MTQRDIIVDPERLGLLAQRVAWAHGALAATPRYAHLDAGDTDRRLHDTVGDFITKNETIRDELVGQLESASNVLGEAWRGFSETESALVRALTGEEHS